MKTYKKLLLVSTALCAVSCAVAGLSACAEQAEHEHAYGDWSVKTAPTADATGVAEKTCANDGCDEPTVSVTLPVLGDSAYAKTNNTATCTADGSATYTYMKDGSQISFTAQSSARGHGTLAKTDGKAKKCTEDGFEAYWSCPDCGQKFGDEYGVTEIAEPVVIPAGHDLYHQVEVEANCYVGGTAEYWECNGCWLKFSDAEGKEEIDDVQPTEKDPDVHYRDFEHRDAVPATCTSEGTEEYWQCPGCMKMYSDKDGTQPISKPTVIPVQHGALVAVPAVSATCQADGAEAYWYCDDCGQKFSDADGQNKIGKAVTVAKGAHTPVAKLATDYTDSVMLPNGTVKQHVSSAYYECSVCNKKFAEEACQNEITTPYTFGRSNAVVISEQDNRIYMTGTMIMYMYFKAPQDGCYAFTINQGKFGGLRMYQTTETSDSGISVYNNVWKTDEVDATVMSRFGKNDTSVGLTNSVYVDLKKDEILSLGFSGITTNSVFSVNVFKAEGENVLILGKTNVTVETKGKDVDYTFTAPADGFYQMSISASDQDAIVYPYSDEPNAFRDSLLDGGDDKTKYIFSAKQGQVIKFTMSANATFATFPYKYSVTVETANIPVISLSDTATISTTSVPNASVSLLANVEVAGTYVFQMNIANAGSGAGRNYYNIYVNGAKVGMLQATTESMRTKIWAMDITLDAGLNEIVIENAMAQSSADGIVVGIVNKA